MAGEWALPSSSRGLLVVVSGPSGVGKGTVRRHLQELLPELTYGVSVTTRPPRPGERNGVTYHFVSVEEFGKMRDAGELVEWAEVYGNYYGTPRHPMEELLAQGRDVIIEKDVQGAKTLMGIYPDAVYVFILPPSLEELKRRIHDRGTDPDDSIALRLRKAEEEMAEVVRYHYVIVNDDARKAASLLRSIIEAERCKVSRLFGGG